MRPKLSYSTVVWVALLGCHLTLYQLPAAFCQEGTEASDITARIRAYKTQLAADGAQNEVRLKLAKVYLQIEAYAEAVDEYQQVIAAAAPNEIPGTTATTSDSDIPAAYYGLGLAYTGLEKFEDAIAAYQRAIAYAPDWAYTHAALGSAYASIHRYAEALDAYKVAVALDSDDEMIHHQIGNVYSKRGEHGAATRHQLRAIAIAPQFAAAHYQLGLLYAHEKRWTDAIRAYRTAYQNDPVLVEALYNLAQASLRAGDAAAAREQMALFQERKAALTPLHQLRGALQRTQGATERAQVLVNIGRFYLKDGHYEKAVSEYQKAIGMDPQSVAAYNGIGVAYTMLEKYKAAVAAQQKALALQPDFAKAHAGIGLAYFRQNKTGLALKHYRQAVTLDPQFLEAHLKIATILLNQQRYAEATDAYLTIISLKPDDAEAHHNLGLCYAYLAKAEGGTRQQPDQDLTTAALTALEKAVDLSSRSSTQPPFLTETYYLIGELQAGQGDFGAAEKAYLSSGLPKAYHALAQLSAKVASGDKADTKGGLETARRYAQEAIHLDPNVASYYNTLALIDFRRGDYRQAEQAIRKALALEPENRNYQQGLKQISGKLAAD
ncbi:tetratricopeptide repeat protein [Candidatus Poribacteria bacterium]|nr:tetratricopeptide repeat protein [Candidatus Poribacteria bacterium]MYH81418.1 tetratricopeptide repeat protein [Candidatus Poribacteria bacterium]MYK96844.1 tetratricopeptide repeat protein [Candidatus Poribacteria bacterium]